MRTTLIALLIVVAAAIALCAFAQSRVCGLVEEMDELRLLAERELRAGNEAAAMEYLATFAARWEKSRPAMEMLTSHDDLHEVYADVVDARVCLERGDRDDCFRALAQLGEALHHIGEMEAVSLSNLY